MSVRVGRVALLAIVGLSCCQLELWAQADGSGTASLRGTADSLRQAGRLPEAAAAYRALVRIEPNDAEGRFWLAKTLMWTGHTAEAKSWLEALARERPGDSDPRLALVDIALWAGDWPSAAAQLDTLDRNHRDDPEVLLRHGRLQLAAGDRAEAAEYFGRVVAARPGDADAALALRNLAPAPTERTLSAEYYGEHFTAGTTTKGAVVALTGRRSGSWWRLAAAAQEKFGMREARLGAEGGWRLAGATRVELSAYAAPDAQVIPRWTFGAGLSRPLVRGLALGLGYTYHDFADASVHQLAPRAELYLGDHWLISGRYVYARTRLATVAGAFGSSSGVVTITRFTRWGGALTVSAAAGGEPYALPSLDQIGRLSAKTIGLGWRHFVTPAWGFAVSYAHQVRSTGGDQDSYTAGVLTRW